jgi:hypothetical protein
MHAGINFARDGMQRKDWLALVAVHSDSWLLSVAFFYGVKLDQGGRWACSAGTAQLAAVHQFRQHPHILWTQQLTSSRGGAE